MILMYMREGCAIVVCYCIVYCILYIHTYIHTIYIPSDLTGLQGDPNLFCFISLAIEKKTNKAYRVG